MQKIKRILQKWLEIPEKHSFQSEFNSALEKQVVDVKRDNSFWRNELKERTPNKKCLRCGIEIAVWPFNKSVSYYIEGDKVEHVTCPSQGKKQ